MSDASDAWTIVGLKISEQDVYDEVRQKIPKNPLSTCSENHETQTGNYCFNCGQNLWETFQQFKKIFHGCQTADMEDVHIFMLTQKFGDNVYHLLAEPHNHHSSNRSYFLATDFVTSSYNCPVNRIDANIDLDAIKQNMKKDCDIFWNEDNFGIWSMLDI